MNKRPGYSPEVRERAVRLVLTSEHEHTSVWAAIQSIATKMGSPSVRLPVASTELESRRGQQE